jgi:16S rRNA (cytidine1402-2'-O)-methyltransferase
MSACGSLFLIPAPLGENRPADVLPAYNIQVINSLSVFVVEDLRSARRFLRKINPTFSIDDCLFFLLNEHTVERFDCSDPIRILEKGTNVGLLSEAGLPCIADPGATIVKAAHIRQVPVVPLVGPCSIVLALMASGLCGQNFTFHGYLPAEKTLLDNVVKRAESVSTKENQTQIFIETPYRNMQLLNAILTCCQSDTWLSVAINLTLENEYIRTQTISQWRKQPLPPLNKQPAVFLLQG